MSYNNVSADAKHKFINYPEGSTLAIAGRSCVKCKLPPENEIHETDERPSRAVFRVEPDQIVKDPKKVYDN